MDLGCGRVYTLTGLIRSQHRHRRHAHRAQSGDDRASKRHGERDADRGAERRRIAWRDPEEHRAHGPPGWVATGSVGGTSVENNGTVVAAMTMHASYDLLVLLAYRKLFGWAD